jgi:hypothetical protein
MMMIRHLLALSLLCALGAADPAHAQGRPAERLPLAKSLACEFTVMATGTWNKGVVQGETKPAKLTLGFDTIDADEGTARVIGRFGPSDIIVRLSLGTLHFVQSFREGPLYATTIFPSPTLDGKLKAVHTRHEFTEVLLPGFTSRPEQYYGECEILR